MSIILSGSKEILGYEGHFDYEMVGLVLKKASRLMDNYDWNLNTKKRVYCVMVESLENIDKHTEFIIDDFILNKRYKSKFSLSLTEQDKQIVLNTRNIISSKNIPELRNKIEHINSLSEEELKIFYKRAVSKVLLSEKGGADLGFINLAKTSKNKLQFDFERINLEYSYFMLSVTVNLVKKEK